MGEQNRCVVCAAPTEQKCSNCLRVYYCSQRHQMSDWKQHKLGCTAVRAERDPALGRYLRATRDIKTGDCVIEEQPLLVGPLQVTPPVCLGCYKVLEEDKVVTCPLCEWPFCSEPCTKKEEHKPECHYTQNKGQKMSIKTFGVPHPSYGCVAVLRCLYQRDHNAPLWAELTDLEAHAELRAGTEKWRNDKKTISDFILNFFNLRDTFTEEEIMKCCGIIQVNGHEMSMQEPGYVAVYKQISLVEHSCIPNCSKGVTTDGKLILCAAVNIAKGSHISICYTEPLWDTEARRHHLAETKFFECACPRCADVTELGTMYSAVKCKTANCSGYLLPDTFLQPVLQKVLAPTPGRRGADDKKWKCGECKAEIPDEVIQNLLDSIGKSIFAMPKGDPAACVKYLKRITYYLHPSHRYVVDVTLALGQLIGNDAPGGLAAATDRRLYLKRRLCINLLWLLKKLAPGHFQLRGYLMHELHHTLLEIGKRPSSVNDPEACADYEAEAAKLMRKAKTLFFNDCSKMPLNGLLSQHICKKPQVDEDLSKMLNAALPNRL